MHKYIRTMYIFYEKRNSWKNAAERENVIEIIKLRNDILG